MNNPEMWRKLEKALAVTGTHHLVDILDRIQDGSMQSWVAPDEVTWVITRIGLYPRKKVVEIFMVVGTMAGVDAVWPRMVEFAIQNGATEIWAQGRNGWQRKAAEMGFKPIFTTYIFGVEA